MSEMKKKAASMEAAEQGQSQLHVAAQLAAALKAGKRDSAAQESSTTIAAAKNAAAEVSVEQAEEVRYVELANDLVELPWRAQEKKLKALPFDVNDVSETVDRFRHFKGHTLLPCVEMLGRQPIPVDVSDLAPAASESVWQRNAAHAAAEAVGSRQHVKMLANQSVIAAFKLRLSSFLLARLRSTPGSAPPSTLEVRIYTHTLDARLFCSPATLLRENKAFGGGVTSPVLGQVGPGRYVFGIESAAGKMRWDFAEYKIPPVKLRLPL